MKLRNIPTATRLAATCFAALTFTGLAVTPLLSQETPQAEFEGEVMVQEVLLDVLVTDKDGNVIIGLDEGDFVVEEDGEAVEVTGATFYSNRRLVDAGGVRPATGDIAEVPTDRYFVFFFHDQRTEQPSIAVQQLEAARYAKRWIEQEKLPNDYVAVASYDVKLKVQQDFTTDSNLLLSAIDDAAISKDKGRTWPSRQDLEKRGGPSLVANLPSGKELRKQTKRFYQAMELMADASGQIVGRKNLLLFSSGFGDTDNNGVYTPDVRFYPTMMRTLNDNNVAVYSIDMVNEGFTFRTRDSSLSHLSSDTGGQYYTNFNNFLTPLRQVGEDTNGYYLLSYRSSHPTGESGYQKVRVNTTNKEFKVRGREGYLYGG